jgi:hypothetical protein
VGRQAGRAWIGIVILPSSMQAMRPAAWPPRGEMEYVDSLVPVRCDQHEVDTASMLRNHPADAVEQPRRVSRDDLENRLALRVRIVEGTAHKITA